MNETPLPFVVCAMKQLGLPLARGTDEKCE
jgi:hypothetical protein